MFTKNHFIPLKTVKRGYIVTVLDVKKDFFAGEYPTGTTFYFKIFLSIITVSFKSLKIKDFHNARIL